MKKLYFLILIFWASTCGLQQDRNEWKTHKEEINAGFTIEFSFPPDRQISRIENGICISPQALGAENEFEVMREGWCLWMEDAGDFDLEEAIATDKSQLLIRNLVEKRSSVCITNKPATRVQLRGGEGEYLETIFFIKFNTIFNIMNRKEDREEFERFLQSLRLYQE